MRNPLVDKYLNEGTKGVLPPIPEYEPPISVVAPAANNSIDIIRKYVGEPETSALTPTESLTKPSVRITQTFNQPSAYDVFSGNINTGVDFATEMNTPIELPEDDWEIEDAYSDAIPGTGYIGNADNQGYGNSLIVRNARTGERLRFSHLNSIDVAPGQRIRGGRVALSGLTGNTSGSHVDAEYFDPEGNLADILQSPYASLFGNPVFE